MKKLDNTSSIKIYFKFLEIHQYIGIKILFWPNLLIFPHKIKIFFYNNKYYFNKYKIREFNNFANFFLILF